MKILVIQLARLGDIFQTWPALRALRRAHPTAEIHGLVRGRFAAAFDGLTVLDRRILLPTQDLMAPLLNSEMDVKKSFEVLKDFVMHLKNEEYDLILNFTFSPFSSYLTHAITNEKTQVAGYTRTADGYLAIPDDMSAYFYAQVGIDRPNRHHLVDIFGTMAQVDFQAGDWAPPSHLRVRLDAPEVLIHVGASEMKKQISPIKWTTIINQLNKIQPVSIGLIGSSSERHLAEQIVSSVPEGIVADFVGKTNFEELFSLIAGTRVLIGSDSAPMHMASLTGTTCVNLSLAAVNFWETGPRSKNSIILRGQDETDLASDRVAQVVHRCLIGEKQDLSVIRHTGASPCYWMLEPKDADFQWNLLKALYMGEHFPKTENPLFKDAMMKLAEINLLILDQMQAIKNGTPIAKVASIIDRGEEIIQTIGELVPPISPFVRWYQTEKIRIGPDSPENLLARSMEVQELFQRIIDLYLESYGLTREQVKNASEAKP